MGVTRAIAAGTTMPAGADAVLMVDAAECDGARLDALAPVAAGGSVLAAGAMCAAGAVLLERGTRIGPVQAALCRALGIDALDVVAAPEIALVLAGPKPPDCLDALALPLAAMIARDGGTARVAADLARARGAALVLVVGRSGIGPDDDAPERIAAAGGRLAVHGIALRPGDSAGLGTLDGAPLVLLPGDPAAALIGYEMLAGRVVRRLAGRAAAWPHAAAARTLRRKLVSPIGLADVVPVLCDDAFAAPLLLPESGGLATLARANGFVLVAASREGYAAGSEVWVNLWNAAP
jgi:molybdopterin molybdotransferase